MKKKIIILCVLALNNLFSQDTIIKKDNQRIPAKIIEINTSEVKYKKANNLDGPIFIDYKADVFVIKYLNGSVDTIRTNANSIVTQNANTTNLRDDNILVYNKKLYYHGKKLSNDEFLSLIELQTDVQKRNRLKKEYIASLDYKKAQYAYQSVGLVLGFAVPIVTTYATLLNSNYYGSDPVAAIVTGAIIGAAIRTVGLAMAKVNKNKRFNKQIEIAEMYNNLK